MHVGAGFGGSSPKINLLQYYLITVPQVCISTVLWAPYLGEVHVNGISHQNLAGAYLGAESKGDYCAPVCHEFSGYSGQLS